MAPKSWEEVEEQQQLGLPEQQGLAANPLIWISGKPGPTQGDSEETYPEETRQCG